MVTVKPNIERIRTLADHVVAFAAFNIQEPDLCIGGVARKLLSEDKNKGWRPSSNAIAEYVNCDIDTAHAVAYWDWEEVIPGYPKHYWKNITRKIAAKFLRDWANYLETKE